MAGHRTRAAIRSTMQQAQDEWRALATPLASRRMPTDRALAEGEWWGQAGLSAPEAGDADTEAGA